MISAYFRISHTWMITQFISSLVRIAGRRVMETKWKATKRKAGTTLIVDCYFYSGVVFASAKGIDVEWCKAHWAAGSRFGTLS
ncbi:hypothetical protein CISIN_1g034836mg [Citrus sinensis]|uniref:Uncharacterized protein n=1 Tax=Citrus sinensis TaxID=2711 RepID=A0A067DRF9_CITSI|nr:hypothetical protein CISIN_1g034836mg [Citrus sinensis]KDO45589.1 hypothetical protein CISIN_1g034836mg [Citrus sinensis]